jgi:hypothetical protein
MICMLLVLMTSLAFFMASLFSDPLAAQLTSIGVLLTLMVFCGMICHTLFINVSCSPAISRDDDLY